MENLIFFLDLSHNFLSGSLPLWSSNSIHHLHLEDNNFSGSIPNEFFNISELLLTLDVSDNRFSGSIPSAIANAASSLRILSLRGNCLSGTFPTQLCQLTQISKMDLSRNFFSGTIPHCFQYLVTAFTPFDLAFSTQTGGNDNGQSEEYGEQDAVNIVTKYRNSSYTGNILNYMLGLDLSCNNLTGVIPLKLGQLQEIHALNLPHNQLTGSIPKTLSNLTELESLDLSHNSLIGKIPSQLIELTFLAVFSVAYNNLLGRTPDMKAQFGTFSASDYC